MVDTRLRGPVRIVVIGWGPVSARLVEGLVQAQRNGEVAITVIGAEPHDAYNRVLVAEYAVGRADRARLDLTDAAAAITAGVDIRRRTAVVSIDRDRQSVELDTGESVPYDRLVLATGARATVPTLAGLETAKRDRRMRLTTADSVDHGIAPLPEGVLALRDLEDAQRILTSVRARRRIVVLGAGVLGMEFALAAAEEGGSVIAVHHGDVPMGRNLDRGGGKTLSRAAKQVGVDMAAHARAEGILFHERPTGGRSFQALLLADGGQINGDLLILSCGVTARDELAAEAGLAVGRGVLVDDELRSWTDPDIFAIGDCAHVAAPGSERTDGSVPGGPPGLIGPGWRQADWLAARLADEARRVRGATQSASSVPAAPLVVSDRPLVVMLKAEGVDVVAGGDVTAEPWDDFDFVHAHARRTHDPACQAALSPREVTLWTDPARGSYVKLVTRDGVLQGFVSVGMPRAGAELALLFERGGELPADRAALLRLDTPDVGAIATGDPMAPDATVCWCNGVMVGTISAVAASGATTVEAVGACTRAGTGCGTCKGRIAEVLARTRVVV